MSERSNNQGRAFEFVTLLTLCEEISKVRRAQIERNSSYYVAERAWNSVDSTMQNDMKRAAAAVVEAIFDFEPLIIEDGEDALDLQIQPDGKGEEGDVRDILIVRRNICWEIGLSLKHNHFAVKHSRLAKTLDFGLAWFGVPCSDNYWDDVAPVFRYLDSAKERGMMWRELPDKNNDVYIPLLDAFMKEVKRSCDSDKDVPRKMVEYLLGRYDFYKVISIDTHKTTQILTFNLRGDLNKPGKYKKPKSVIPISTLPTRIVEMGMKPGKKNTVEMYMDGGWQFSFRIHNAATRVETSLKFDVQIIGMPTTVIAVNCIWR